MRVRTTERGGTARDAALLALSVLALFVGFEFNAWRAADPATFRHFQRDAESLIVGRLVQSRQAGLLSASLQARPGGVIATYFGGSYLARPGRGDKPGPAVPGRAGALPYGPLIVSFGIASALALAGRRWAPSGQRPRITPLVVATWVSILAPLSWFFVFKSHSYIHTHINFVVWQMPFTLFGFATWGVVASLAWSRLARSRPAAERS
jgi:hypothetical protein